MPSANPFAADIEALLLDFFYYVLGGVMTNKQVLKKNCLTHLKLQWVTLVYI